MRKADDVDKTGNDAIDTETIVIGAGYSGLAAALRLHDLGIDVAKIAHLRKAILTKSEALFGNTIGKGDFVAEQPATIKQNKDFAPPFHDAITRLLPGDAPRAKADRVVTDLTALAVAMSDGVYFAEHLESDTDVERMYRQLFKALKALIPILLEE